MMKFNVSLFVLSCLSGLAAGQMQPGELPFVSMGVRPYWLIDEMRDTPLKEKLQTCAKEMTTFHHSDWSIAHRGACMQLPEHTYGAYKMASIQGAGIIECDVTFTKDRQLICRHAQCDLHYTTNVVTIPELNAKCTRPWEPFQGEEPLCCATDFTLDEIKLMCAKMESRNNISAATPEEFAFGGTATWRTEIYAEGSCPEVLTHKESIELINSLDGYYVPELKFPQVEMPFEGDYTQEMYAQQLIDEYIEAGIPPSKVWPQSFYWPDVYFWVKNTDFGDQAVALDDNYDVTNDELDELLDELVANGGKIVAPPMWRLVEGAPDTMNLMKPTYYAGAATERGLDLITWSFERSPPGPSGWFWQTSEDIEELTEGDRFTLLNVLHEEIGVVGVFCDWPATSAFYANCMGLKLRKKDTKPEPEPPTCQTIMELACGSGSESTLCTAIEAAGLGDELAEGEWTVFAPTDEAFENIPGDILANAMADTDALTNLLLFHVVKGETLFSADLPCKAGANRIEMANGFDTRTLCVGGVPTYQRGRRNSADMLPTFEATDIEACNGVIHVISEVLLS